MVDPGEKATCVKADTFGLPSDHMLNYAGFDVVMELVLTFTILDIILKTIHGHSIAIRLGHLLLIYIYRKL